MTTSTTTLWPNLELAIRHFARPRFLTMAELDPQLEAMVDSICEGECPCCDGGQIEPDWERALVHYEEDPGDPIYGPPPSYEFLIEAKDWSWLECCELLDQFLKVVGGKNDRFNERLLDSPLYGVDAWRESWR